MRDTPNPEEELNRKLAERYGFTQAHLPKDLARGFREEDWIQPDGRISIWGEGYSSVGQLPDFTESLDASFKWLVPEAINILKGKDHEFWGWKRLLDLWQGEGLHWGKEPALALCLAIEKLAKAK